MGTNGDVGIRVAWSIKSIYANEAHCVFGYDKLILALAMCCKLIAMSKCKLSMI